MRPRCDSADASTRDCSRVVPPGTIGASTMDSYNVEYSHRGAVASQHELFSPGAGREVSYLGTWTSEPTTRRSTICRSRVWWIESERGPPSHILGPVHVNLGVDHAHIVAGAAQRPDSSAALPSGRRKKPERCFDTAAFALPPRHVRDCGPRNSASAGFRAPLISRWRNQEAERGPQSL